MRIPFFKSELIRNGATIFMATLLGSMISFLANIVISNVLGPDSFGNFKVIVYLFAFLPVIADLGINSTLTKYISEFGKDCSKAKCLIRRFLEIKVASYAVMIVALFLLREQIATYLLEGTFSGFLVAAVGTVAIASSLFGTFSFIALGFQSFKTFGAFQLLSSASSPLLAVLLSPFGLFYMLLGWAVGPLIGSVPAIFLPLKKTRSVAQENVDIKGIFRKFSLPVWPIDLTTNLSTITVPIVSLLFARTLVGYYSFAFMFYYVAMLIPNSLSFVLFPKVSELHGQKNYEQAKQVLRKSFLYYSAIAIAGLAFVVFLSEWFLDIVAPAYLPSLNIFKVIVSIGFVLGFNVIYTNYLKGLGKIKRYAILTLLQNALLMAASLIVLSSFA